MFGSCERLIDEQCCCYMSVKKTVSSPWAAVRAACCVGDRSLRCLCPWCGGATSRGLGELKTAVVRVTDKHECFKRVVYSSPGVEWRVLW
jgi:hypothetical protein